MTLTLNLPPDLEARVDNEAARRGLSPADYALELLRMATTETLSPVDTADVASLCERPQSMGTEQATQPLTGAEIVAKWRRKGLIGTRTAIADSVEYVQEMRRKAETRDWS